MRQKKHATGHIDPEPGEHSFAVRLRDVRKPGMTLIEALNLPKIVDEVFAAVLEKNNIRRRRVRPHAGHGGEP